MVRGKIGKAVLVEEERDRREERKERDWTD